jgi:hypothetical protein
MEADVTEIDELLGTTPRHQGILAVQKSTTTGKFSASPHLLFVHEDFIYKSRAKTTFAM